jgi:hypothetical protein
LLLLLPRKGRKNTNPFGQHTGYKGGASQNRQLWTLFPANLSTKTNFLNIFYRLNEGCTFQILAQKKDLDIFLEAANSPSTDIVPTKEAQLALPYIKNILSIACRAEINL